MRKPVNISLGKEARSNLKLHIAVHNYNDLMYVSLFRRTQEGIPLSQIKQPPLVDYFADKASEFIIRLLHLQDTSQWGLLTPPSRRHKGWNFAHQIANGISQRTGVRILPTDILECLNNDRIDPIIYNKTDIPHCPNIVLFDDIVTTGQTLRNVLQLLEGRNVFTVVGIR